MRRGDRGEAAPGAALRGSLQRLRRGSRDGGKTRASDRQPSRRVVTVLRHVSTGVPWGSAGGGAPYLPTGGFPQKIANLVSELRANWVIGVYLMAGPHRTDGKHLASRYQDRRLSNQMLGLPDFRFDQE